MIATEVNAPMQDSKAIMSITNSDPEENDCVEIGRPPSLSNTEDTSLRNSSTSISTLNQSSFLGCENELNLEKLKLAPLENKLLLKTAGRNSHYRASWSGGFGGKDAYNFTSQSELTVPTELSDEHRPRRASYIDVSKDSVLFTFSFSQERKGGGNAGQWAEAEGEGETAQREKHCDRNAYDEMVDWELWGQLASDFDALSRHNPEKITQAAWSGVPSVLRGMIWQLFTRCKDQSLEMFYNELLKKDCPFEKWIALDAEAVVGVAMGEEENTINRDSIFNLVKAYVVHDEEIGYAPQLCAIARTLLLNMPEEEAFCLLVCVMQGGLRNFMKIESEELRICMYQLDRLLEEYVPHIYQHLIVQECSSSIFANEWFMTLFSHLLPANILLRVWDVILAEGMVSLFQFAIAFLQMTEGVILGMEREELVTYLRMELLVSEWDAESLLQYARAIHITEKQLKKLEREQKLEVQKTQEYFSRENSRLDRNISNLTRQQVDVAKKLIESKAKMQEVAEQKEELAKQNADLEQQLFAIEEMLVETRVKYAKCEDERETLFQRLASMKKTLDR
ncbi:uncharacterized protein VTP21DRAFT_8593 [Calcarisporiella thermophila]|uniref:uncharacterized protein n=1 Tax=Calcarisporiella thermophila TaxID=911321 RepID=UPI0037439772